MEGKDYFTDVSNQQQLSHLYCNSHPEKTCAFYCSYHNTYCCVKCVTNHIQCQMQGHFEPLEDIHEKLKKNLTTKQKDLIVKVEDNLTRLKKNEDKMAILENLKNIDISTLESLFDDIKKKTETLREKALQNYNSNYELLKVKINDQNQMLETTATDTQKAIAKIINLQTTLDSITETSEKHIRSIGFLKDLDSILFDIKDKAKYPVVDDELENLYNREEIFSELGNFSLIYNNIESRLAYFIKEHFPSIVSESLHTRVEKATEEDSDKYPMNLGDVDQKIRGIEELRKDDQIYEETFVKILEEQNESCESTMLHQLRYSSNEIYVFDTAQQKFYAFELFTSNTYKTPFIIFNNSASCIYKNHLIFIFGGEDPNNKDKSSNRVFCLNIEKKNSDNRVIVYEINRMINPRQEFTLNLCGHSVFLFSGYNINLAKDKRVITKCERLDLKSKKFYEIRDINYPRQWASSINFNNNHVYLFGGQNPNYVNNFVEKVEKYLVNLNDWSVLKYTIPGDFLYLPNTKSALLKVSDSEIAILGGRREDTIVKDYYIFDTKKMMFVKKSEKPLFKEDDEFLNQNDLIVRGNSGYILSGYFASRVYKVELKDKVNHNYNLDVIMPPN